MALGRVAVKCCPGPRALYKVMGVAHMRLASLEREKCMTSVMAELSDRPSEARWVASLSYPCCSLTVLARTEGLEHPRR